MKASSRLSETSSELCRALRLVTDFYEFVFDEESKMRRLTVAACARAIRLSVRKRQYSLARFKVGTTLFRPRKTVQIFLH